ncbi:transcriptional regulator, TetR family [Parafrankia sp. EUN1f]|nr:transcriptional regulator, TetR family [Parafrankia sp. EUN1f]
MADRLRALPPTRTDLRRQELLAELTTLFLREGFSAFSLAMLAERLHCSKTTLYLVAGSKEQIVVATVRHYFRTAAERIETLVAASDDPVRRLRGYLLGVSAELKPASEAFYADLTAFAPADAVYQENTVHAARRVRELVDEGVAAGVLRPAHAAFVGAAVTQVMTAIQRGDIAAVTGLNHADAYRELTDLVLNGLGTGS